MMRTISYRQDGENMEDAMRKEIIVNGVNITERMIQRLRDKYPTGTRIRLVYMNDPVNPVPPGTVGTVTDVDDIGNIHMK